MKHRRTALASVLSVLLAGTTLYPEWAALLKPGSGTAEVAAASQAGLLVTRGPYLQMGTSSSVVVRWRTNSGSDSEVLYGPDPATLIWRASLAQIATQHEVTLSALLPNTKYFYAVGSTGQTLAGGDSNHFFITSPATGTAAPTRVWVLGDSGTADANAASVRDAYYGFAGSTYANLWLMLGDNAYNGGTDTEYQAAVFDMFPRTLRQSVLWPTVGNHDIANSAAGTGPYYDMFTLPKQAEAGGLASGTEAYYSFDYGNIHFICLDSFDVDLTAGSPMMTWLQSDLASTAQRWIIAFWHHPPYSKGSHDSDVDYELTQMRQNALPLLEAAGVDLVLSGHSHSYERSFLIDGHYGLSSTFNATMKKDGGSGREDGTGAYTKPAGSASHAGAVYTVAGSSGFAGGGALNHPAMFISLNVMGSLVLDVNDGRLDARFVDNTSTVRDYFTILKGAAAPVTVPDVRNLTQAAAVTALTAVGLVQGTVSTASSPTVPMGSVISQNPSAGTQLAAGGRVDFVLSTGVTVPDVTGQTQAAAKTVITSVAGLSVSPITTALSTVVAAGSVISQNPAGNTNVSGGTSVALVVSSGPPTAIVVPNVVNLTQTAATAAITGAGLSVGAVTTVATAAVPVSSVVSQSPAAGSQASAGAAIDLAVSSGVTVPPVVGLTQAAATTLITGTAGLHMGAVTTASSGTVAAGSVISQNPAGNINVSGGSGVDLVVSTGVAAAAAPVTIGTRIAGTFADATGHSAQSHLFYAANAGVWWLLTLTSTADSQGGTNHIVKAYRSSGPDLATATWTAAADSPGASALVSSNCSSCFMGGGRALGVAYVNNAPTDVVHAEVAMAYDGQNGLVAHIRAKVTATSITWESWNYHDEPAGIWTLPRGPSLGASTGKYIHSAGPILQQEVDANIRKSVNPDTASSWTSGFSSVSVVDNSMINQSNSLAFAPLASNTMLAVFDNGGGTSCGYNCVPPGSATEPNITNLGYKKSRTDGSWPGVPVGGQATGDGQVFSTPATIDQNDWTLVASSPTAIQAFRSNATGSGIDAAAYSTATNTWGAFPSPPPFGAGQALKKTAGVFGASSGSSIWLFLINTDAANSILYTTFDGTNWTAWGTVPGTGNGPHARRFISGYPVAGTQIGLIWTEGTAPYDVVTTAIALGPPDTTPPMVSMITPAGGSTVSGPVAVSATASDNVAVARVQFQIDSVNQGAPQTAPPYGFTWDSTAVTNGSHSIVAIAVDAAGNTSAATAAVIVTNMATVPNVVSLTQAAATASIATARLTTGTVTTAPSPSVPIGSVISQSVTAGSVVPIGTSVDLVVSAGVTVPQVVGQTEAAARALITSIAGLSVGLVTTAPSTTVPAGSVISQNPAGSTNVSGGTSVALVVSSGAQPVPVPNVVGLTQAAATTAIANAGLTVGAVTTAPSTTVAAGSVISQVPAGGAQAPAGSAVNLVVALATVPNVVNLTQAAATASITNAGLTTGAITTAPSSSVPIGSVITQSVAAGAFVPAGTRVDLAISSGVTVPQVVGQTEAAARALITGVAGLSVGLVTTAPSSTVPAGLVISQNPAGSTNVSGGTSVALVVSSGPPPGPAVDKVITVNGRGTRTTAAFSTSAPAELLLAFVASDGPSAGPQSVTVSGAGLTWTLVRRANTRLGTSEVWKAMATAQLTNVTVRSTQSAASYDQSLTVVAFRNASGAGASAGAGAASGAPSVSLTTTAAASLVYAVGNDWDRAVGRTLGPNQTTVQQWIDTGTGDTFWVQKIAAVIVASGTVVQVNDTAPTTDQWNFVAVEILSK